MNQKRRLVLDVNTTKRLRRQWSPTSSGAIGWAIADQIAPTVPVPYCADADHDQPFWPQWHNASRNRDLRHPPHADRSHKPAAVIDDHRRVAAHGGVVGSSLVLTLFVVALAVGEVRPAFAQYFCSLPSRTAGHSPSCAVDIRHLMKAARRSSRIDANSHVAGAKCPCEAFSRERNEMARA